MSFLRRGQVARVLVVHRPSIAPAHRQSSASGIECHLFGGAEPSGRGLVVGASWSRGATDLCRQKLL